MSSVRRLTMTIPEPAAVCVEVTLMLRSRACLSSPSRQGEQEGKVAVVVHCVVDLERHPLQVLAAHSIRTTGEVQRSRAIAALSSLT